MPSKKRHSSSGGLGRSKRSRSGDVIVAGSHKLRSRSQSISYKEPEDDDEDFMNEDNIGDEDENGEVASNADVAYTNANGIVNEDDEVYSSNTDNDNGDSQPSARNVKIRIPQRLLNSSEKTKIEDDDEEQEEQEVKRTSNSVFNDDDDEDEPIRPNTRRSRSNRRAKTEDDDDEYVASDDHEDEYGSEEDNFSDGSDYEKVKRREDDRNFIVSDEDDNSTSRRRRNGSSNRRRRAAGKKSSRNALSSRRSRGRRLTRRNTQNSDSDESYKEDGDDEADAEVDHNSLQEELEDLKATPEASPPRKHLRERKKNINYQLPPPLPDNVAFDDSLIPPVANVPARKIPKLSNGLNKGLFPVAGPFGGNDIIPILGSNLLPDVNVTGGSISGHSNNYNNPNNTMNFNDSSSSDDDFVTRPYDAALGTTISTTNNNGATAKKQLQSSFADAALGLAGTPSKKQTKKKNAMADSDPLGIDTSIDFSSVGGLDKYIDQLKEMVALPLLYPEVYAKFDITPPRGVLFHGPPGTGKTLMARALASSCSSKDRKITFFMRKGADCLSKWVGEAERQLRLLFEEAKNKQPSIIFFDEIDGLAPVRSSKQEQIHSSIVSTMLALMDGMDNRGQVIVIGATNRPDAIDPALRRPGRFDREFYFALPDLEARTTILNIHTKKWLPKPPQSLIQKLAQLTKGYGGSDIRALCTEAALNSIKRRYPQIYDSEKKLLINPDEIRVNESDFTNALERIVPSSARSTGSASNPIPEHLGPLLEDNYTKITYKVDQLISKGGKSKGNAINLDSDSEDEKDEEKITKLEQTFGMSKHDLLKKFNSSRVFKPRLLISGKPGMGQKYLGSAILNYLEGFQVQSLDLGTIFADSGRTPEATIIQMFLEARKNQPSIIFIPTLEIWLQSVPESAKATLVGLLRTLNSSERVLLLGLCEMDDEEQENLQLKHDLSRFFGVANLNNYSIKLPDAKQREDFFKFLFAFLETKPIFNELNIDDPKYKKFKEIKDAKNIEKLPVAENEANITEEERHKTLQETEKQKVRQQKQQYKNDVRLKNLLKIKLSTIMEVFKTRYKRFKKPIVPLQQLAHLFEPSLYNPVEPPQYTKDGNMILDTLTGQKYFNMELDTIEERLWNGYYSEPKQFLKDVEMIYLDAKTSNDRERSLKASELFVNAQVSIEELFSQDLLDQCKDMRKREIERQKEYEAKIKEIEQKMTADAEAVKEQTEKLIADGNSNVALVNGGAVSPKHEIAIDDTSGDGADDALATPEQAQLQMGHNGNGSIINISSAPLTSVSSANGITSAISAGEKQDIRDDKDVEMVVAEQKPQDGDDPKSQIFDDVYNESKELRDTAKSNAAEVVPANPPVPEGFEATVKTKIDNTPKPEPKDSLKKFTDEELAEYDAHVKQQQENRTRELILDTESLEKVKSHLVKVTENFTVEELELVNSLVSESIWQNRNEWDRNKVLKTLEKKIKNAVKIISNQKSNIQ